MNSIEGIVAARDQLNRTLTFFVRVDTKASVVFGVNTALLAVLATRALPWRTLGIEWFPVALTLLLLGISFWNLYEEAFPSLDGGEGSLLYFREISRRSQEKFYEDWKDMSEEQYLRDLLGQVWINSEILSRKFNCLRRAYYALAAAILPWAASVALLSFESR